MAARVSKPGGVRGTKNGTRDAGTRDDVPEGDEIQRPWCVGDVLGCVTSGNRAQEPSGTVEREGDEEGDVYGSGAFSFSGLVGPEPVAEADAAAAFSPAATLVGVAAPLRAFAAARACACIWWCLDLPDAASATILRDKGKT